MIKISTNVGEIDLSLILNSNKFKKELKNVNNQANTASTQISASLSKIGKAVTAAFSVAAIVKFGKECLNVATETTNAWIGLNSILTGQGKSFNQAKAFINDYISDGLVPLNNAVAAYKNLTLRGYNSDQIQKTMNALKNSATFARQSTYTLGEAVQTATEGLKNENSVVVDNAGVTKNVAKMWEDYAKSIGKTTNNLTQAEKIQAEVNGILEETRFQSNDAAIYTQTYAGKVAQLSSAFTNMKMAIGNVIQPIVKAFIPIVTSAVNAVTKLFTALSGLLSLFGLKADSVETVSSGIGDMASSANNASDAVSGIGDSAKKTAKDIKKSLAGFDEINKLDDNSDSGSSSASGGAGAGGISDGLDVSATVEQDTSAIDGLLGKLKELADIFKEGFKASFGDTNFDGILNHLNNIKKTLKEIWTDPEVIKAADNWVKTLMYTLGQVTGAVARIGVNIAEFFVGSIDKYLSQNKERIKSFIVNMFNIESERLKIVGNFAQALGEISDVFKSDTAKQIGADIIAMFANPFMSALELASKFVRDLTAIMLQPIIDNAEKIKTSIENTLVPIQTLTGTLSEAFTYIGDKCNEVYDTYLKPFFDSLKTGISDTFGKFLDIYNEYIVPFLQYVADGFSNLWEQHLQPFVDKVAEFIGAVIEALQALWEGCLKPLIDWIIQNVIPAVVPVLEKVWDAVSSVFGSIVDTIKGIIEILTGLINFIVGVFTGDWDKAWTGIKQIFGGIWDAIKGIVSTIWNAIKGIITTAIEAVKSIISIGFNAIKSVISTILNAIKTVVTTIWNGIKSLISSVLNAIRSVVSNIWNNISSTISNTMNNMRNCVSNGLSAISNAFSNIFNGIWNVIRGICNSILGGIESMVNGIINGVNTIINAFNGLRIDIPDWVPGMGGKQLGFSIPNIGGVALPRLAQGGYVKANTPQLAVIGDNKTQGEYVLPEDKLSDFAMTILKAFKSQENSNQNNIDGDIIIPIMLDSELISRRQIKRSDLKNLATNGRCYA